MAIQQSSKNGSQAPQLARPRLLATLDQAPDHQSCRRGRLVNAYILPQQGTLATELNPDARIRGGGGRAAQRLHSFRCLRRDHSPQQRAGQHDRHLSLAVDSVAAAAGVSAGQSSGYDSVAATTAGALSVTDATTSQPIYSQSPVTLFSQGYTRCSCSAAPQRLPAC